MDIIYEAVEGRIEVVGPMMQRYRFGRGFEYIRLLKGTGEVVLIKNIMAPDGVASYLQPNAVGTFYFAHASRGHNKSSTIAVAYKNDERRMIDEKELQSISHFLAKRGTLFALWCLVIPAIPAVIVAAAAGITWGLLVAAVLGFFVTRPGWRTVKFGRSLSPSKIRPWLQSTGF